ncbi:MAG: helix-turn-helix domain-containing protein [Clostridia bacterium]|nr:helix-turn-helix domain-containing protein [Clostridia bacterium]
MNNKRSYINVGFTISQESYDTAWTMPYAHYHNDYEIYILKNGQRTVTIAENEYITSAKSAVLFSPNTPHKSRGDEPFSGICIHFSKLYLDFHFTATAQNQLLKCFENQFIIISDDDFNEIQKIADNFEENKSNNFITLSRILDMLSDSVPASNENLQKNTMSISQSIIAYVDQNYTFIRNIREIAEEFDVSERYVFKIFKKEFASTPKQYINSLRLRHACHRIIHSDKSIKSIAQDSGFECYEYFVRVFKKEMGITPSQYRKSLSHM